MIREWAGKRVCKFLLKRLIGKFILGDLDLDRLDVQFSKSTSFLQLSKLPLDVEYINEQLGIPAIRVKEGLVGSLSIRIPWKILTVEKCEIELEDLELILVPETNSERSRNSQPCSTSTTYSRASSSRQDTEQEEQHGIHESISSSGLGGIHDGVKMIAKMMERLLLGLHVKIKNLIVVLESERNTCHAIPDLEDSCISQSGLAFRVVELEYGTDISGDYCVNSKEELEHVTELGILTKKLDFSGATFDLYKIEGRDVKQGPGEPLSSILTGQSCESQADGIAGTITLSIPWKSGCMDIPKVDAVIHINPIKVQLKPSTLCKLISILQSIDECNSGEMVPAPVIPNTKNQSTSHVKFDLNCDQERTFLDTSTMSDAMFRSCTESFSNAASLLVDDMTNWSLIPDSMIIPDWIQNANLGESFSEFLECWDGTRSMQAGSTHGGLWNLTCSVFGAITAASTLASGSVPVSSRQQQVEYNLNMKLDGICIFIMFEDSVHGLPNGLHKNFKQEDLNNNGSGDLDPNLVSSEKPNMECSEEDVGCLCLNETFMEINLLELKASIQVFSEERRFNVTLKTIEIWEYIHKFNNERSFMLTNSEGNFERHIPSMKYLQRAVERTLPEFPVSLHSFPENVESDPVIDEAQLGSLGIYAKGKTIKEGAVNSTLKEFVKIKILTSENVPTYHFSFCCDIHSKRDCCSAINFIKFEVQLQPFVLWLDFYVANNLWKLSKALKLSSQKVTEGCSLDTSDGSKTLIQGRILMPWGRIILCFPGNEVQDMNPFSLRDHFVCVDVSLSAIGKCEQTWSDNQCEKYLKNFQFPSENAVHIKLGGCALLLVSSAKTSSEGLDEPFLFSKNVFDIKEESGKRFPVITVRWQDVLGKEEGRAERAWRKAKKYWSSKKEGRALNESNSEFLAVATVRDFEGSDAYEREDIIQSSSLFIHVSLPHTKIELYDSEHIQISCLLTLFYNCIFHEEHANYSDSKASDPHLNLTQTSFLIECKDVHVNLRLVEPLNIKVSPEKELSGIWTGFQLEINEFMYLNVSNLGGMADATHFWLNHHEGILHGILTERVQMQRFKKICLISCKDNALGRGDGAGTNALACGNAGTTVIYFDIPQQLENLTRISIKCGTLVAPGGRLDWISSIVSYFTKPTEHRSTSSDASCEQNVADNGSSYCSYFSLELLDIAVSYEPFLNGSRMCGFSTNQLYGTLDSGASMGEAISPVAGLLAASELSFSSLTKPYMNSKKYTIFFHDIGLSVLDLSKQREPHVAYDARGLQSAGYVKVAEVALLKLVLKNNCQDGCLWKVVCKNNHICLNTCHDTTVALIHLVTQLQQLVTPDLEDYIVHLETKETSQNSKRSLHVENESAVANPGSGTKSTGLMSCIIEDVFTSRGESNKQTFHEKTPLQTHSSQHEFQGSCSLNAKLGSSCCYLNSDPGEGSPNRQKAAILLESMQNHERLFPVIEDYCFQSFSHKSNSLEGQQSEVIDGLGGWYTESSFKVVEDHLSLQEKGKGLIGNKKCSNLECRNENSVFQIMVKDFNVSWRMNAGSDWPETDERNSSLSEKVKSSRNSNVCFELELSGLNLQYNAFPDGGLYASKLCVTIDSIFILDQSELAPWKTVLLDYHSKTHPRESSSKALRFELEAVRPDPSTPLEEYRLHVKMLPLRFRLAQSQLEFFINFFSQQHREAQEEQTQLSDHASFDKQNGSDDGLLPFFQKCKICPMKIHVSYVPQHVDLVALGSGNYAELLNIVPLKDMELHLKGVETTGVYGWNSLSEIVVGNWLEDIAQNQVCNVLEGVAPIRSLLALVRRVSKLVSVPAEHYRKDRPVISRLQRGMLAFARSVSLEAVSCGVHLASGAHGILTHTESALGNLSPSFSVSSKENLEMFRKGSQPANACQGLQQACETMTRGLERTASSLIRKPAKSYARGDGARRAILTAIQAAPAAAFAPASAAAGAVHRALLGVRNSLDPDGRKESEEKHSGPVSVL